MKLLKILFISIVVILFLAFIGIIVFIKTFDPNRYKSQIISAANDALKRELEFDKIELKVSLKEGVRLKVNQVSLSDDPEFQKEKFLTVNEAYLGLDLAALIFGRKVNIAAIELESPKIVIIRRGQNKFNVMTIGQSSVAQGADNAIVPSQLVTTPPAQVPQEVPQQKNSSADISQDYLKNLPQLTIDLLSIKKGTVTFIDQSGEEELVLPIEILNFNVDHFSLNHPFKVTIEAAVINLNKNFEWQGNVQLDLARSQITLNNSSLKLDLGQLPLDIIRKLPELQKFPLPQELKGQLSCQLKELTVGPTGLGQVLADVDFTNGRLKIADLSSGIDLDVDQLNLKLVNVTTNGQPFSVALGLAYLDEKPNVTINGMVSFEFSSQKILAQNLKVDLDFSKLSIEKLRQSLPMLAKTPMPEEFKGRIGITIKELKASPSGIESMLTDAAIQDGKINFPNVSPGISFAADQLNASVKDFSLDSKLFAFNLNMAYLASAPNISLNGQASFDLKNQDIQLKDTEFNIDLSALSLKDLKSSVALLEKTPLPQELEGKLNGKIKKLSAGAKGLGSALVDLNWKSGKVLLNDAAPGITLAAKDIDLSVTDFSMNNEPFQFALKASYAADMPNIDTNGQGRFDLATQTIQLENTNFTTDLSKFSLDTIKKQISVLAKTPFPESLKGNLTVKVKELSASAKGLGNLRLDSHLKNGVLSMKDVVPGISFELNNIDLAINDFSLVDKPFKFEAAFGYLSDAVNIRSNGQAQFNLSNQSIKLGSTNLKVDLSSLNYEKIKSSVNLLSKVPLPEYTKGAFNLVIEEAFASPKGLVSLTSSGEIIDGIVKLKELAKPVEAIQTKFKLTQSDLVVDDLTLNVGVGKLQAKLSVLDYLKTQKLDVTADIKNIQLAELVDQNKLPVKFEGILNGNFKASGDVTNISSIIGDGSFVIKDAVLKDFDLLGFVLLPLQKIPLVGSLVSLVAFPVLDSTVKQISTSLDKAETAFQIQNGIVHVSPLTAQSPDFQVNGEGDLYLNNNFTFGDPTNLPIKFFVPKDSLARLFGRLKSLEPVLISMKDSDGNLNFTLVIKAKEGKLYPAVSDLVSGMIENKGKELLKDVLGDVFKKQGISTTPQTQEQNPQTEANPSDQDQSQEPSKSLEEEVVDTIFGTIFKKK